MMHRPTILLAGLTPSPPRTAPQQVVPSPHSTVGCVHHPAVHCWRHGCRAVSGYPRHGGYGMMSGSKIDMTNAYRHVAIPVAILTGSMALSGRRCWKCAPAASNIPVSLAFRELRRGSSLPLASCLRYTQNSLLMRSGSLERRSLRGLKPSVFIAFNGTAKSEPFQDRQRKAAYTGFDIMAENIHVKLPDGSVKDVRAGPPPSTSPKASARVWPMPHSPLKSGRWLPTGTKMSAAAMDTSTPKELPSTPRTVRN